MKYIYWFFKGLIKMPFLVIIIIIGSIIAIGNEDFQFMQLVDKIHRW